ncbi:methyltransferase domain-containing protein [Leptolyngbya cf. ectocarpi LEGE 11479]|uniref:Methyltransferase domain-containing protein n=1 Tax=Leptolyngbya cf. ectocarpi LEGE 11479 TaxID=1828722 RepID=A0A928ZVB2_LEPEC|nr:class I SAM-dependent methyltransferase [Leptolyngbya ectocarpi]MBE9068147.1 methyltransferase domain-containing protein [Leptolyngbya cf. ectocarpi LEGE 11479]
MTDYYKEDLAYIHDVGYSDYACQTTAGILSILRQNKINDGLIVDLGCGSGLSALEFVKAGYRVLGIDISHAMIGLARARVPSANFRVASLFKTDIPLCQVVTAIGECLNYLFDSDNNQKLLFQLFKRIHQALSPGGVFIFDMAEPGQVNPNQQQHFNEGHDWLVLVEKEENLKQATLTRRIITLRKVGAYYRRDEEVHHVRLYHSTDIAHKLRQVGFTVQTMRSYGKYQLPKAHVAFIARKAIH